MTPEEKKAILQRVKDEYAVDCSANNWNDLLEYRIIEDDDINQIIERYITALAPTDEEIEEMWPSKTSNGRALDYNIARQESAIEMRDKFTGKGE